MIPTAEDAVGSHEKRFLSDEASRCGFHSEKHGFVPLI